MKKLITIILCSLVLAGCCSFNNNEQYNDETTTVLQAPGFNQEKYVWENLYFSTNQVEKVY